MSNDNPRVVFATPEYAPMVKTGGLGDVSASLPAALARLGVDLRVLVPGYAPVLESMPEAIEAARLPANGAFPAACLLAADGPHGVPMFVLDCPPLYYRPGGPYQNARAEDWPDNALRFAMLSRVAALLGSDSTPLPWRAEVVHCNDWQTGLAPAYLAFGAGKHAASLITIHNLAYQGSFGPDILERLGLPASSFSIDGVEFHGKLSFLKAGLRYAEAINTVSPSYAREIQDETLGFGFHGLLAGRADALTGILSGIDTELWNPATDPLIARRYDRDSLDAKRENKRALQERLGLDTHPAVPLIGMVSRLTHQKGTDLLIETGARLVELPVQLAVQGVGDPALQDGLRALARRHPGRIAVRIGFDEALAHLIEAGADMFLMPSRFEPCGLNQMYSQRYGTPPIVRGTGGLLDSVVDCTAETLARGTATGFVFRGASGAELLAALERAIEAYRDARVWPALQRNGMARDFGWSTSAARYLEIYRRIAARG